MGRKIVPLCSDSFYHITARTNNRDWFAVPMENVWRIMSDYLFFMHHAFGAEIIAFVLMGNHFHLIARFPSANMSEAMQYFMRETSRSIAYASHRTNHVYGSRYFRSRIKSSRHLDHVYKYVYRNPVEARLAVSVHDYRYSTLRCKLGFEGGFIPVIADNYLFNSDTRRTLDWLNTPPSAENLIAIKKSLRRAEMRLPRSKSCKPHALETNIY
jgi:putative transposase